MQAGPCEFEVPYQGGIPAQGSSYYMASSNAAVQALQLQMTDIAPTEIPVLLVGESGTGKAVAAWQIHRLSKMSDKPFINLSCAAFTADSFRVQLQNFENGHAPEGHRPSSGTLFLDEVAELDADCQRYLLHSFPDGDGIPPQRFLTARIISCSTHDLEDEVKNGRIRSELYYRMNGVCLRLPPLRQRKEDIPGLIDFFLDKHSMLLGRSRAVLCDRSVRVLMDYSWPGNIRELENVMKKIVALRSEELAIADLVERPVEARLPSAPLPGCSLKAASRAASRQAERELILQTLARTHWNRKRAAEVLQVSYKSLLYKLKQIHVPNSEGV